jgi:hypothetical protein
MNDCRAQVTVHRAEMEGQTLKITFSVDVHRCPNSVGRFDYDIVLRSRRNGQTRNERRTSPNWAAASGNSFSLEDEFEVSPNDEFEDVVVDERSIQSRAV